MNLLKILLNHILKKVKENTLLIRAGKGKHELKLMVALFYLVLN